MADSPPPNTASREGTPRPASARSAAAPVLDGRFLLVAQVAHAPSGSLWEGTSIADDQPIEVLRVRDGTAGGVPSDYLRQMRLMARVMHPSISRMQFSARDEEGLYAVFNQRRGRPLSTVLEDLPPERAVDIGAHLARGLRALHQAGLANGPIDPMAVGVNVDFEGRAEAKLLPCHWLWKAATGRTPTPSSLAPELNGQSPTPESDQWALAALLRTMLPRLPTELDPVIKRLGDRDPAKRYEDFGEAAGDLDAVRRALSKPPPSKASVSDPTSFTPVRDLRRVSKPPTAGRDVEPKLSPPAPEDEDEFNIEEPTPRPYYQRPAGKGSADEESKATPVTAPPKAAKQAAKAEPVNAGGKPVMKATLRAKAEPEDLRDSDVTPVTPPQRVSVPPGNAKAAAPAKVAPVTTRPAPTGAVAKVEPVPAPPTGKTPAPAVAAAKAPAPAAAAAKPAVVAIKAAPAPAAAATKAPAPAAEPGKTAAAKAPAPEAATAKPAAAKAAAVAAVSVRPTPLQPSPSPRPADEEAPTETMGRPVVQAPARATATRPAKPPPAPRMEDGPEPLGELSSPRAKPKSPSRPAPQQDAPMPLSVSPRAAPAQKTAPARIPTDSPPDLADNEETLGGSLELLQEGRAGVREPLSAYKSTTATPAPIASRTPTPAPAVGRSRLLTGNQQRARGYSTGVTPQRSGVVPERRSMVQEFDKPIDQRPAQPDIKPRRSPVPMIMAIVSVLALVFVVGVLALAVAMGWATTTAIVDDPPSPPPVTAEGGEGTEGSTTTTTPPAVVSTGPSGADGVWVGKSIGRAWTLELTSTEKGTMTGLAKVRIAGQDAEVALDGTWKKGPRGVAIDLRGLENGRAVQYVGTIRMDGGGGDVMMQGKKRGDWTIAH